MKENVNNSKLMIINIEVRSNENKIEINGEKAPNSLWDLGRIITNEEEIDIKIANRAWRARNMYYAINNMIFGK